MTLLDSSVRTADGVVTSFGEVLAGRAALVVNVASKCGLTPQYQALQELQDEFADAGFTVVGFPCNQFGGQEPGSIDEITQFCATTYGTSFPVLDKVDVNGPRQDAVWAQLTAAPDADGQAGEVEWNFEKFVVSATGEVVARLRPMTHPLSPEVREAVTRVTAR